jgi:iron complex transport system substrate-binding protein
MLKPMLLPALLTLCGMLCAQVQVTDDLGLPVTLTHAAERVITLAPHTAELMVAVGAGSKLIGVAAFHDYPAQINNLPVVSHFSGLDRERLLMLNPDLVIAWGSGNKPNDIAWLKSMNIPVYLSEPSTLEDIPASMQKLGQLTGQRDLAQQAADKFRTDLDRSCTGRMGQLPQPVYYEIWPSPPMTIGGKHWLNQVLGKASLYNVFADQDRQIISVTPEALLARPIAVKVSSFQQAGVILAGEKLVQGNDQLARPGPRIIEGLRLLCDQL